MLITILALQITHAGSRMNEVSVQSVHRNRQKRTICPKTICEILMEENCLPVSTGKEGSGREGRARQDENVQHGLKCE